LYLRRKIMKKRVLSIIITVAVILAAIPSATATDTISQIPTITTQPAGAVYYRNATASSLTVEAHVTDGGTLTYQWYSNITNSSTGGTAIEGATNPSLIPSTTGTHDSYYYVVVTNTTDNNAPVHITSNVAAIYFKLDLGEFAYTLGPWPHVHDYRREYVWSVQTPHPSAPKRNLTRGILRNAVELRIEFKEEPSADIMFIYGYGGVVTFSPVQGMSFVFDFTSVDWAKIASDDGSGGHSLIFEHHSDYDLRDIIESATLIYRGNVQTCNMCPYEFGGTPLCRGCSNEDCMSLNHVTYCRGLSAHWSVSGSNRPSGGGGNPGGSTSPTDTITPTTAPVTPLAPPPAPYEFTTRDALNILRYVAGLADLTEEQRSLYDLNGDGEVNTADALAILRKVAGL
jgi:hypothetical protein